MALSLADAHSPGVAERPAAVWLWPGGGQMTPEQYLALMTMHGSIMVFMVLTTAPQSGFGNYIPADSDWARRTWPSRC